MADSLSITVFLQLNKKVLNNTPLTELNGVGPKTAELFLKIGISSQEELLRCYPRDYDVFEDTVTAGSVIVGKKNAVLGRVRQKPTVRRFGNNSITMISLSDPDGVLQVNWYHMPYLRNTLHVGKDYVFRGTVLEKNGRNILQHPEVYSPEEYTAMSRQMLPVYTLTEGLSSKTFRRVMKLALQNVDLVQETLPEMIRRQEDVCSVTEALSAIHFPDSHESLMRARKRLVFEEFFFFLLAVSYMRLKLNRAENMYPMPGSELPDALLSSLPYELTAAQKRVWKEISDDLNGPFLMHRLIQGDVGSGKTILAFLAMLRAFENGFQSALMAPTDVLATQHFETMCRLLEEQDIHNVCPVLLKGSMTARQKRETGALIAEGKAHLVIGTHALIQDAVSYAELGLVITDEQHRFGVRQRGQLTEKGNSPHVLVMSATPIPRTLSMILYGDLDISVLDELPASRLPVKNCVVNTDYREAAYRFIEKEAGNGHQIYVVCPMIEPGEDSSCENVLEYSSILTERFGNRFPIAVLHGRMNTEEKQKVMEQFADGSIRILVSTTVIEVGIDVPNATVMMIENAERFGLAQLHQLRGRVGRGDAQSYCIFVQGNGKKEIEKRLEILDHSNDGFYIAEEDLKLRGPGDLLGVRQSGETQFRLADIYHDAELLNKADLAVQKLLEEDPELEQPEHQILYTMLEQQVNKPFETASKHFE